MSCEFKATCLAIYLEDSDVVSTLIAGIEISTSGIEVEAARIISSCPFFPNERQVAVWANRKYPDAIVQSIACIDKLTII